jgi:hypothetical protein
MGLQLMGPSSAALSADYVEREVVTLNDDFTRSNGAPGTDPASGYTWGQTGATNPIITSNRLVATAHGATSYATFAASRPVVEMRASLSFVAGGGTDATPSNMVLASSSTSSASPWNLVHVIFNQTGYMIQKAVASTFTTVASGSWTTPIPQDGTAKSVKWRIDGTIVTVTGPNGETASATDADFATVNGRYGFFAIEPQDANAPLGRFHSAQLVEVRSTKPYGTPSPYDMWIPDSGVAQSYPLAIGNASGLSALTSGTVYCSGITLPAGVPINWVEWFSSSTAANTPTNQWAVLMDLSGRVVAVSSNLTTTAWAGNTRQRFTFTSQFTPAGAMPVWAGLCVTATAVPTLAGINTNQFGSQNYAPRQVGASSAGQTTPPSVGAFLNKPALSATGYPYVVVG